MTTCTDCNELVRHCTCGMTRAERKVFLPAPSCAADGRTPLHNVPGYELLVSAAEFNRKVAEVARLQALSVTRIMIDVVPGEDGMGEEIFARTVADVEGLLSKLGEQAAEAEMLQAQVDALAGALQAVIKSNERWGLTKARVEAIAAASAALAAVGRKP